MILLLVQGRLLAQLDKYLRKSRKGIDGCKALLTSLIASDGLMPPRDSVHTQLCVDLAEQDPDPMAVYELLTFYTIDDQETEGILRVSAFSQNGQ